MIRSLARGLAILALLNRSASASAAELATALGVPRATSYRLLWTLRDEGFVYQHHADKRFRLTVKVRSLSDGFTVEDYLTSIAPPILSKLTQSLVWPVALAAISGGHLVVRETTDDQSPFATQRFRIGYRIPLQRSASGLCVLAHMRRASRKGLFEKLGRSDAASKLTAADCAKLEHQLREIKNQGFAVYQSTASRVRTTTISVPILQQDTRVRGALTIRFSTKAVALPEAIAKFLPSLRSAASEISERISSRARLDSGRKRQLER